METKTANVFLSYAREDASLARVIASMLDRFGVHSWIEETPSPTAEWRDEFENRLEKADLYVLLITPHYLKSLLSNFELGVALSRSRSHEVTVIPLTSGVTSSELPSALRRFQVLSLDLNNPADIQKALERALEKKSA